MGLDKSSFAAGYMDVPLKEQQERYVNLLLHIFCQLESLGFKATVCIAGHYPLIKHAGEACSRYMAAGRMRTFAAIGYDLVEELGYRGDRTGVWETSLLMALHPELVDMDRLAADPDEWPLGVHGDDPRSKASTEFGEKAVDLLTDRMVQKAREVLASADVS